MLAGIWNSSGIITAPRHIPVCDELQEAGSLQRFKTIHKKNMSMIIFIWFAVTLHLIFPSDFSNEFSSYQINQSKLIVLAMDATVFFPIGGTW